MLLIVGLGNPGTQYEWTRHNLGFMLVDMLARRLNVEVKRTECQALVGRAQFESEPVELVKPQTFMNLSGEAVKCLLRKHESAQLSQNLIVISDDLALPFGEIRLRPHGSSGGHNGLKSIIAATGTTEFIRLRIGIKPEHPISNTAGFVLDKFPTNVRSEVKGVLETGIEVVSTLIRSGINKAMSQYNE